LLHDCSSREARRWSTTPLEVAASHPLATQAVVARVTYTAQPSCAPVVAADSDGEDSGSECEARLWDLTRPLEGDCSLELLTFDDPEGRNTFWHSSAHVLGAALEREFGGMLTVGPAVQSGFYYDVFLGERRLSEADFPAIQQAAEAIVRSGERFRRLVVSREEALELFAGNPFKVDLIERRVPHGASTVTYRCGDLVDLCRGPHLPSAAWVKAFAVMKSSSSYWRGSAEKESLQRIYGVSFPSSKELRVHTRKLDEAKARDHRRIGRQQDLFFFEATASPGSCFWTAHGTRIYNKLTELMRAEYRRRGFDEVITPNIYAAGLFKRSGHADNYRDDMYGFKVEGEEWFMKPMNCPGHCVIYGSRPRSYRELPLRLADFGVLHRNELSGTLSGLTRVRRFQQDDAHIFCTEAQLREEVSAALAFVFDIYELFGFEYSLALSTRPKRAVGSEGLWARAETQLVQALDATGKRWKVNKGDGAFYGPKVDITLRDALGRSHQCGTVQLDFQLPLRFDLRYQADTGCPAEAALTPEASPGGEADREGAHPEPLPPGFARPVIVHRAILGSLERMTAVLCEHFAGRWPFWLSPRQCIVVPVSEDAFAYAEYVRGVLRARGLHAEASLGSGTLGKKIREAQVAQWNYILVVGREEEQRLSVSLRQRGSERPLGSRGLAELAEELEEKNRPGALAPQRRLPPFVRRAASSGGHG